MLFYILKVKCWLKIGEILVIPPKKAEYVAFLKIFNCFLFVVPLHEIGSSLLDPAME